MIVFPASRPPGESDLGILQGVRAQARPNRYPGNSLNLECALPKTHSLITRAIHLPCGVTEGNALDLAAARQRAAFVSRSGSPHRCVPHPGGLEPPGGIAQSASVLHERRSLQDVSGDIAT